MVEERDTQSGSAYALMMGTLEVIGGAGVDIVPLYFERFFAAFPQEESKFENGFSSQGSMVNEMVGMLLALAADEPWVEESMASEVQNHRSYEGVTLQLYREGLDCLVEVLRSAAGPNWTREQDSAWREQSDRLFAIIERSH